MTGLVLAVVFGFGVVVGVLGRGLRDGRNRIEVVEVNDRQPVEGVHRTPMGQTRAVPYTQARRVGLIAVALAVALNALSGFLVWRNGVADRDRVDCTVDYNVADGEARDARNDAAATSTDTELVFLRTLKRQTLDPPASPAEQRAAFLETINARIESLRTTKTTRSGSPYPTPDACRDGHLTDDEKNGEQQ